MNKPLAIPVAPGCQQDGFTELKPSEQDQELALKFEQDRATRTGEND